MEVHFTVPGPPVPKGRPRFRRAGNFVSTYTPVKTANYEARVKAEYLRQCGTAKFAEGVPLEMRVIAYFPIPKSAGKKKHKEMAEGKIRPMTRNDVDNLLKAVADAGNKTIYPDDGQIVDVTVRKFYSELPRTVVFIREAEGFGPDTAGAAGGDITA